MTVCLLEHGNTYFFKRLRAEDPTQVLSREYCEIFKSAYFEEHQRTAARVYSLLRHGYTKFVRYSHERRLIFENAFKCCEYLSEYNIFNNFDVSNNF